MGNRRVVVTGMGTVNPLANNWKSTWERMAKGDSGIDKITVFDSSKYPTRIAGEVKNFDFTQYFKKESLPLAKRFDTFIHYASAATKEALSQSKIEIHEGNAARYGIALGTGIGGVNIYYRHTQVFLEKGLRFISPYHIPLVIGNMAAGYLSIEYGLKGPNVSVQTACASGNHALESAYNSIVLNRADMMVSGGCEGVVEQLTIAGFCKMKALSTNYNDTPHLASRPFDKNRDGFVLSEGAAVLVLEEYEHAKKRKAEIFCEIASVGTSSDAFGIVAPHPEGDGACRAMQSALAEAQIDPQQVDYINCHGTSTLPGDITEIKAVERLFGNTPKNKDLCIASTKSMTGHMIGATSGLEAIVCVHALSQGCIPGNVNLFELDEQIKIPSQYFPKETTHKPFKVAISNSFGFGGHNTCLVLKAM